MWTGGLPTKAGYLTYLRSPTSMETGPNTTTTTARILQRFVFLCKLGLLLLKPHWDYQI